MSHNYYFIKLLASIFAFTFFLGCAQKNIEGEVFFVNQNGSAKKLALAKLYQFDEKQMTEFKQRIEANGKKLEAEFNGIVKQIGGASMDLSVNGVEKAKKKEADFADKCAKSADASCIIESLQLISSIKVEKMIRANKISEESSQLIKRLEEFPSTWIEFVSQEIESTAMQEKIQSTKTDSDGKFSMKLSSTTKRILVVPESKDIRSWLLWMIDSTKIDTKMIFSNENKIGSNCADCIKVDVNSEVENSISNSHKVLSCLKNMGQEAYDCYGILAKLRGLPKI